MGMREEFEAAMPKPEGVYWYEDYERYMTTFNQLKCIDYNGKWEGWCESRRALNGDRHAAITEIQSIPGIGYKKASELYDLGLRWVTPRGVIPETINTTIVSEGV